MCPPQSRTATAATERKQAMPKTTRPRRSAMGAWWWEKPKTAEARNMNGRAIADESVREHIRRCESVGQSVSVRYLREVLGIGFKKAKRLYEEEARLVPAPDDGLRQDIASLRRELKEHLQPREIDVAVAFVDSAIRLYASLPTSHGGNMFHQLAVARDDDERKLALALLKVMPTGAPDLRRRDDQGLLPRELALQHNNAAISEFMEALEVTDNSNEWISEINQLAFLLSACPLSEASGWRVRSTLSDSQIKYHVLGDKGTRMGLVDALDAVAFLLDNGSSGCPPSVAETFQRCRAGDVLSLLINWLQQLRRTVAAQPALSRTMTKRVRKILALAP